MLSRLLICAFCLLCAFGDPAPLRGWCDDTPPELRYQQGEVKAMLECKEVRESSGVATSRLQDGTFWTHNDSGNKPRLYAFRLDGTHLGSWNVEGVTAQDWEDMASFERNGRPFLGFDCTFAQRWWTLCGGIARWYFVW